MTTDADIAAVARRATRSLTGVTHGYPLTSGLLVHKVCGRVFLVVTENLDQPLVTVKADPSLAEGLVRQHPTISPGRYFDERHWVSVEPGPGITDQLVESLVQDSYDSVVGALPRRDQDLLTHAGDDLPAARPHDD